LENRKITQQKQIKNCFNIVLKEPDHEDSISNSGTHLVSYLIPFHIQLFLNGFHPGAIQACPGFFSGGGFSMEQFGLACSLERHFQRGCSSMVLI
jgi:hypothetical protein